MIKIFLSVPYSKKDEFKKNFKIEWDNDARKWFSTQENLNNFTILKQYIYLEKPLYYNIPYKLKDDAKILGGIWDVKRKKWKFHYRPEIYEKFLLIEETEQSSVEETEQSSVEETDQSSVETPRIANRNFHTYSRRMR